MDSSPSTADIPRPLNPFFIFLNKYQRTLPTGQTRRELVAQAGKEWEKASKEVKLECKNLAKQAKLEHAARYPDYKYEPKSKAMKLEEKKEKKEERRKKAEEKKAAQSAGRSRRPKATTGVGAQVLHRTPTRYLPYPAPCPAGMSAGDPLHEPPLGRTRWSIDSSSSSGSSTSSYPGPDPFAHMPSPDNYHRRGSSSSVSTSNFELPTMFESEPDEEKKRMEAEDERMKAEQQPRREIRLEDLIQQ